MVGTIAICVAVGLAAACAAILGYAASKPNTFHIERSARINAPPEKVFALINDFHSWVSWSPWEKIDPALKRTYSGAANGEGAVYEWEGNKKVGQGRMEITRITPPFRVAIQLDFIKPFEAHNTAEFTLETQGDWTNVTWSMEGQQPFGFKVMTVFVSMDRMVGKDFETGLANLKGALEVG